MRLLISLLALPIGAGPGAQNRPASIPTQEFSQRRSDRYGVADGLPDGRIAGIAVVGDRVLVRTAAGVAALVGRRWEIRPEERLPTGARERVDIHSLPADASLLDAATGPDGVLWAVTTRGAYRLQGGRRAPVLKPRAYRIRHPQVNADAVFRCVAVDRSGHVWFGTDYGIYVTDGADWWNPIDRSSGLPYEDVTCLALGPDGGWWVGTTEGVCRCTPRGEWQYYWGSRWLTGNRVSALAVAPDGSAWVASDGGVAHLYDMQISGETKAAHYEQITGARHNRRGYVTGGTLKTPGRVDGGVLPEASDNDGLWTAVYAGAEIFRYAATRDPEARSLAKRSIDALLDLQRYTGVPGFPARALLRKGEEASGYDPKETVRVPGETDRIWFPSPRDPDVLCKGDTSSDETDGHYFALALYYDLVAGEEEKPALRSAVRALTDNILGHQLTLVGPTGRATRWGVWNPTILNEDPAWWEERGINALEILAYLRVAEHVCGDAKYGAKFRELAQKHHYLLNTVYQKVAEPWYGVNHSDDQMAFMMYYCWGRLEKDPAVRRILIQSLERSWKIERPEASPFFNFVYGAITGRPCDIEASWTTLQDWPWELIDWEVRNTQRTDVTLRSARHEGRVRVETDRVLPVSERPLMRWNGNPYSCDGGSQIGRAEEDGGAWLLPYWMGRFHGFLR